RRRARQKTAYAVGTVATGNSFGECARAAALAARARRAPQVEIENHCLQASSAAGSRRLRRCRRAELRLLRADCTQPLTEAGPGPRLDFPVPQRGLRARRLEVLEPGVGFLDHQQLLGFTSGCHGGIVGPE